MAPAGPGRGEYRYHPMLREVLTAELYRELPAEVPALLGRAARWHARTARPSPRSARPAQGGDWEFGAQVLADAGAGVPWPGGPAELEGVLAAFPPDRRAGDAPVAAALAAARLWQGDADGAEPHLECARRSLDRLDSGTHRVVGALADGAAGHAGRQPADAGPGWLAGEWARASRPRRRRPRCRSTGRPGCCGSRWAAPGCGAGRSRAARHALARASAQLAAGSLPGMRARAIGVAGAGRGPLRRPGRRRRDDRARWRPSPAARHREVGLPAGAGQRPGQPRQGRAGRRPPGWLDEADQAAGCQLAGEPRPAAHRRRDPRAARRRGERHGRGPRAAARLRAASAAARRAARRGCWPCWRPAWRWPRGSASRAGLVAGGQTGSRGSGDVRDAGPGRGLRDAGSGDAGSGEAGSGTAGDARLGRARLLMAADDDKGALEAARARAGRPAADVRWRDRLAALLIAAVAQRRLSQVTEAAESHRAGAGAGRAGRRVPGLPRRRARRSGRR